MGRLKSRLYRVASDRLVDATWVAGQTLICYGIALESTAVAFIAAGICLMVDAAVVSVAGPAGAGSES